MTAQQPDRIVIEGEEWALLATPLDALLDRLAVPEFEAPHTANWRGYVASWRISGDALVLDAVEATVRDPDGQLVTVRDGEALGGIELPVSASWVTGHLRAGTGDVIRHVHADFGSRWARELLVEVVDGRVVATQWLATGGEMGSAGPYHLHEPLLGDLSGGAFGQVIAATDLDGRPLVAKAPRPTSGGGDATEVWRDTPEGPRPVHVPALAVVDGPGGVVVEPVDAALVERVLRNEADLLERDVGELLPRSYGLWEHDPSGTPVLVMERLDGRRPSTVADVRAVLAALASAAERGSLDHHGDVKLEHVFLDGDRVRLCDPAPRFDEPGRRAFTPLYNPRAHRGPAADVAACATILRYLPGGGHTGWRWCEAVLDGSTPPDWAHAHAAALDALDAELRDQDDPPLGWSVPPVPGRTGYLQSGPALPLVDSETFEVALPEVPSTQTIPDVLRGVIAQVEALQATFGWMAETPDAVGPGAETRELVGRLAALAVELQRGVEDHPGT